VASGVSTPSRIQSKGEKLEISQIEALLSGSGGYASETWGECDDVTSDDEAEAAFRRRIRGGGGGGDQLGDGDSSPLLERRGSSAGVREEQATAEIDTAPLTAPELTIRSLYGLDDVCSPDGSRSVLNLLVPSLQPMPLPSLVVGFRHNALC
jgi:hypothetical protein